MLKKIGIIVAGAIVILGFQVITSRMIIMKFFFTPKVEKPAEKELKNEPGEFYLINDLIINPAESGGRRHLMVSIGLEYRDALIKLELEKRDPQIRDNLITLLAGQQISVLSDIKFREKIRESLLNSVNYFLEAGQVEKLYFVSYVFQ
ncbi:MAG: flagellar basal body-associated FliL family protein [bacterium]|nr:flagellar basal body-associated FliL family protein [bacterium]